MLPLNLATIDKEARQLRTAELQRLQGLFFAKVGTYVHLLAGAGGGAGAR